LFDIEQNLTRETHFHSGATASRLSRLTAAIIRYNDMSDNIDIYRTNDACQQARVFDNIAYDNQLSGNAIRAT
jgi:hypothetical protein